MSLQLFSLLNHYNDLSKTSISSYLTTKNGSTILYAYKIGKLVIVSIQLGTSVSSGDSCFSVNNSSIYPAGKSFGSARYGYLELDTSNYICYYYENKTNSAILYGTIIWCI